MRRFCRRPAVLYEKKSRQTMRRLGCTCSTHKHTHTHTLSLSLSLSLYIYIINQLSDPPCRMSLRRRPRPRQQHPHQRLRQKTLCIKDLERHETCSAQGVCVCRCVHAFCLSVTSEAPAYKYPMIMPSAAVLQKVREEVQEAEPPNFQDQGKPKGRKKELRLRLRKMLTPPTRPRNRTLKLQ